MTTARQQHTRTVHRRLLAAAAVAAIVASLTVGCAKDDKSAPPPPSATPSPSPSSDPQEAQKAALLSVYRAFWDAQLRVYTTGTMKDSGIEKVGADKAYTKIQATRDYYVSNSLLVKGAPVLSPSVTTLDTAAAPPSATITDCLDTTNYTKVDKESGEPVQTVDSNRRHVATYSALKIGGVWQIRDFDISRDRTC